MKVFSSIKAFSIIGTLFLVGCSTTPQSILDLSTTQGQVINILHEDTLDIIDTYNFELQHWVIVAHRRMAESLLEKHTVNGEVNMQAYFNDVNKLNTNLSDITAEYDRDKMKLILAVSEKFEKAKRIQTVIDNYEKSFGFDDQRISDIIADLAEIAVTKKPERQVEKPNLLDVFYQNMIEVLQQGVK